MKDETFSPLNLLGRGEDGIRTHPTEQYQSRCCVIRREMSPLYCHGLAMFNIDSLCSLNNANKAHLPDVHPSESSLKPAFFLFKHEEQHYALAL